MREVFSQIPFSLNLPKTNRTPQQALREVTSKSGKGVYASADHLYKGAIFGRDSLEVADDLMYIKPKLVERILLTLASLAGQEHDHVNEEEPGKIIHEYRTTVVDGRPLDEPSLQIYNSLAAKWGGDEHELAYYGSVDATPHFIKTVSSYCQAYGLEILLEKVQLRNGKKESLIDILEGAIDWLINHLDDSSSGFVEYRRQNPAGIENQVWKDSDEFYIHKNGLPVNHDLPIASIEVQSLAFDGLMLAGEILPSRKQRLERCAEQLGHLIFSQLWLADKNYFALGTDFDPVNGELRTIETITANPAEMLDSTIFDKLPEDQKQQYISAIVREIMGTAFLTDAGIRSRSLSEAGLINFYDYHGSFVAWPKETYDIAKGLRRQRLPALAIELENRLINITRAARNYPEFYYVDERGRVLGLPSKNRSHGDVITVDSTNTPEKIQAWTVSAIMAALYQRRHGGDYIKQSDWRAVLEKEVLQHIPHVPLLRNRSALSARYPAYPYEIKQTK